MKICFTLNQLDSINSFGGKIKLNIYNSKYLIFKEWQEKKEFL